MDANAAKRIREGEMTTSSKINSTVQRLKKNMPVSTNTLDMLCSLLNCPLKDVAEYRAGDNGNP